MYNVAVIEDEARDAEILGEALDRYSKEAGEYFQVKYFNDGLFFLYNYKAVFDIVFMDIKMPHISGLETAKILRKTDPNVVLIFVSNHSKYAISAFGVNAFDYILKPLFYNSFKQTLLRALKYLASMGPRVFLPTSDGYMGFKVSDINYIDVQGHYRFYHTTHAVYKNYGNLKDIEGVLPFGFFYKCHRGCLVNLRNVTSIEGNCLVLGEDKLHVSRARVKEFIDLLQKH